MNGKLIIIGLALLVAMIKVMAEYQYRKNGEKKYHSISLAIIFGISIFLYVVTDYNLSSVLLFVLSYWSVFELLGNWSHNKDWFHVGETANFDKLLRRLTHRFEYLKFALHILSIVIISIILYVD